MHILALIVAVLAGAAFWWWRVKMISEAASEVHDLAGRAWGKYKRAKFRRKVEDSPLETVNDPVTAAVVLMFAVAKEGGELTPAVEAAIRKETEQTIRIDDPTELLVFGKWVSGHIQDATNVVLRYAKLWTSALGPAEHAELVAIVERIAAVANVPAPKLKAITAKLVERLGLSQN